MLKTQLTKDPDYLLLMHNGLKNFKHDLFRAKILNG